MRCLAVIWFCMVAVVLHGAEGNSVILQNMTGSELDVYAGGSELFIPAHSVASEAIVLASGGDSIGIWSGEGFEYVEYAPGGGDSERVWTVDGGPGSWVLAGPFNEAQHDPANDPEPEALPMTPGQSFRYGFYTMTGFMLVNLGLKMSKRAPTPSRVPFDE